MIKTHSKDERNIQSISELKENLETVSKANLCHCWPFPCPDRAM